jgi:hypothetical protein
MNEILSNNIPIIIWYDAFLPIIVEYILILLGIGDGSKRSTQFCITSLETYRLTDHPFSMDIVGV